MDDVMEEERLLEQAALNDSWTGAANALPDPILDDKPDELAQPGEWQSPVLPVGEHQQEVQPLQPVFNGVQAHPANGHSQDFKRNQAAQEGPWNSLVNQAAGPPASGLSVLNSASTKKALPLSANGGNSAAPEDDLGVVETAELQSSPAKKHRRAKSAQKGGKGIRKEKGLKGGKSSVREHSVLQTKRMRSNREEDTIRKFLKLAYEDEGGPGDVDEMETEVLTASWLASSSSWSNKGQRKRVLTPKEEDEFEASVARALGFPADELSEVEAEAGLGGSTAKEDRKYVLVRNHILARWQCNVMSKVSLSQVCGTESGGKQSL